MIRDSSGGEPLAAGNGEGSGNEVLGTVPQVGDQAPGFELQGVEDGEISQYALDDLTEKGAVLIGVYPWDFSPVCTRQLCQLTDMDWYRYREDLTIVGISREGPYAHEEFAAQEGIGFPLLCDTAGELCRSYGVLETEKDGFREVPRRSLFLVDTEGIIQYTWIADDNWDDSDFGIDPVQDAMEAL